MPAKPKHVVGDHWESPGGLGFTVTDVTDDALTVDVERRVRDREGKRRIETRSKTVALGYDFDHFSSAYKKQRKKPSE